MTPAVTPLSAAEPDDPVRAALKDPKVQAGLLHHALSILGRRLIGRPAAFLADSATEAVQETQLRALQNHQTYDASAGPVRAWLHGIMNNVLRETTRSVSKLPVQAVADLDAWEQLTGAFAPDTSEAVRDRLAVDDYLSRLSAEQRELLQLRFCDHLSYEEIAGRLGISSANARVRVCRALIAAKGIAGVGSKEDRP